jgi:hypothetical protein
MGGAGFTPCLPAKFLFSLGGTYQIVDDKIGLVLTGLLSIMGGMVLDVLPWAVFPRVQWHPLKSDFL